METRSGLATGMVNEIYHPDYVAKRMEIGAVMGAAPRKNVVRESSDPGDIIILLEEGPDAMDAAERQDHPKFIQKNPLRHAEQKSRR